MAAATTSSPNTSPQRPNGLLLGDDQAGAFVAGADELEEQVGGFWFERDVADFVDDQQWISAQADELGLELSGVVGCGQDADPVGRGGEQHAVPGLAGPDGGPVLRLADNRAGRGCCS